MAMQFEGSDDYLSYETTIQTTANQTTVCFWARTYDNTRHQRFLGACTNWECRLSGNSMLHEFFQGGTISCGPMDNNVWYHWTFTADRITGLADIYKYNLSTNTLEHFSGSGQTGSCGETPGWSHRLP